MDSMRRVWYALGFTTGFVVVFNMVLHYLLEWVETDPSRGFAVICFTLAAFGFQDLAIAHIMGGNGIVVKPAVRVFRGKTGLRRVLKRR